MDDARPIDKTRKWHDDCLQGVVGPRFEMEPAEGEYRIKRKDRKAKTQTLHAVYFWYDRRVEGSPLRCHIDGRDVSEDVALRTWEYCGAKNVITSEMYWTYLETGKWTDIQDSVPAANRDVTKADNADIEDDTPLNEQHATLIDNAIAAALPKVSSEAEAAQALGSKNRIAELRLAADKAGKAIYEPMYRQYTAEQKLWAPIVKRAQEAESSLNKAILTFRESERVRIAKEQAEAVERQRMIDDANARAADRVIARGEPEEPPEIEDVVLPAAPAALVATYGTRGLKEDLHTILDAITDYDAVYAFLKSEPKVKALLLELATVKVKAGIVVPGTSARQGLI